jgi:hypothetical protein
MSGRDAVHRRQPAARPGGHGIEGSGVLFQHLEIVSVTVKVLLLLATIIGCAACTTVKTYERELLAQPGMSFAADAQNESIQHVLESREASFGGYGASGGGCGCN